MGKEPKQKASIYDTNASLLFVHFRFLIPTKLIPAVCIEI